MRPAISSVKLSDTLTMSLCHDGYWLHDKTRGQNLAMHEKTSEDAFAKALTYYQKRLADVESNYKSLKSKVDSFVSQFVEEDNDEYRS